MINGKSQAIRVNASDAEEKVKCLEEQIEALQNQLAEKDKDLAASKKIYTITNVAEVPPQDYETIKLRNKKLEVIVNNYRRVYSHSGVATIAMLMEDYKGFTKKRMAEIFDEILASDFDSATIKATADFIAYLTEIKTDMETLIAIAEQGKTLNRPNFRQVKFDADRIKKLLRDSVFLKCNDQRLIELHEILSRMINQLSNFFKPQR